MGIVIKDYSGTSEVSIQGVLLQYRKLMLTGEITKNSADDFISKLLCLVITNPNESIDIYIDSPGGNIDAGLQIIDTIRCVQRNTIVNIFCIGECSSMAAFILAVGSKGHRYISEHGKTLIHQPLVQGTICKSTSSVQEMAEHLVKIKDEMYKILSDSTGRSIEEIEKLTASGNHVMDANESIDFGLVDSIYKDLIFSEEKGEVCDGKNN